MRYLITGGEGQLGGELRRQLGATAVALGRAQLDITDRRQVRERVCDLRPEVVINCAAYTQVDKAEQDESSAFVINETGVENLAGACEEVDARLVQISTDYVFGAEGSPGRPWREEDPVHCQGVYARSKLAGEEQARRYRRHFVVRTCGLYDHPGVAGTSNFVKTMLRLGRERESLAVVGDQICTPTWVQPLAEALVFLAGTRAYGTYHVTNTGAVSWYRFATEIFALAGIDVKVNEITTADFGAPAPRPPCSVLDTSRYHRLEGPAMPDWQTSLRQALVAGGVLA